MLCIFTFIGIHISVKTFITTGSNVLRTDCMVSPFPVAVIKRGGLESLTRHSAIFLPTPPYCSLMPPLFVDPSA